MSHVAGSPRHRENRENGQKQIPVRENTGNLVSSSCKLPDPKGICRENFHFFGGSG